MWNLPAPHGFVGFDPLSSVRIYERSLPHWRQEGVTYFTTFRLADSLPEARLRELTSLRAAWERANPPPRSEAQWKELARTTIQHVEKWLDEGAGCCVLRQQAAANIVEE
jgi:putative transposase